MSKSVDISTLQSIQDLVTLLRTEPEITLTDSDMLLAKVTSLSVARIPQDGRKPDTFKNNVWISDDFDATLPDEYWKRRKL